MSQDYHIYIHSGSGGSSGEKTVSFDNRSSGEDTAQWLASGINQLGNLEGGIRQIYGAGMAALTKAIPAVAVGVAVATVTNKVISAGLDSFSDVTGNYEFDIKLNNAKIIIGDVLNPVSVWRNQYKTSIEYRNLNIEKNEKRIILGATQIPVGKVGV